MLYMEYGMNPIKFVVYLLFTVFCKFSVPVFFAISGALLLNREQESFTILKKRVLRIVYILLVFSIACGFFASYIHGEEYDILLYLKQIYSAETYGHLWYLYAYIAFLIALPLLRAMVQNLENKHFIYMFIIHFVLSVIPIIESFLGVEGLQLNSSLRPEWAVTWAILCPCLGYYLEHRVNVDDIRKKLPALWIANVLCIAVSCLVVCFKYYSSGESGEGFFNSFAVVTCINLFLTIKYLFTRINVRMKLERLLLTLGSCSFGVYLLHVFVLQSPVWKIFRRSLLRHMSFAPMAGVWLYVLCTYVVCVGITYIIKRIPILKKLV